MIKRIGVILFVLLALSIPTFSWNGNATGGAVTTIIDGGINYTIHTFTANGTFNVSGAPINATVLVVAGGGGGGSNPSTGNGGGGGGGGLIYNTSYNATGIITVVVGNGGAVDTNGQNSSFGTLIAVGGGKGGRYYNVAGGAGGSGGGGGQETAAGGSGTSGQGTAGGAANTTIHSGGGGGGAGTAGAAGVTKGGKGGKGIEYTINGSSVTYGCGGSGSTHNSINDYTTGQGCGGGGGDGQGKSGGVARAPTAGTNGTGSGGGGGGESYTGAIGGNGIVIVRYETPPQFNVTVTAPAIDDFYTYNNILENITCSGDLAAYILNVYLDDALIDSNYAVENNTPFITYNYMSDGAHILYATCTNGTKTVQSPDIDFTVQGAPKMNITAPLDGTTGLSSTIAFGYYGTSLEPEISCIAYLDGILNQTDPLYSTGTYAQFVINNIANGAHTIEVNCTDSYATEGSSGIVDFGVNDTSGGGGNVTGSNGFWVSRYCLMPSISNRAAPMTFFTRLGR